MLWLVVIISGILGVVLKGDSRRICTRIHKISVWILIGFYILMFLTILLFTFLA